MSRLKLAIDRQNRALVARNGSRTSPPALFQYNLQEFQIQVVDPTGEIGTSSVYSNVDLNGSSLRVAITPTPTGTAGGPTVLALQTTWTWDATNQWFTGSIDLSPTTIGDYIGTASSKDANFEVTITTGGNRSTIYQATVSLRAAGDEGTASAPTPSELYLPKSESDARYVKHVMDNGGTIVIPDSNGVYALEIKCNTDGTAGFNVITL